MTKSLAQKQAALEAGLRRLGSVMVAYSGGIDSAYLAWVAHRVLGDRMLAVIADSASLARTHLADAIAFAEEHGIPLKVIQTAELANPDYQRNDSQRCFHCKDELFTQMERFLSTSSFKHIAYGRNLDDSGDFRPGQRAAADHHAVAPLADAQLTKAGIRALAHAADLRLWDKPASACLSSRVEYGRAVTAEVLAKVEAAEEHLRALGYKQFRVRYHGELARIEIAREELAAGMTLDQMDRITASFRALGFQYVTLDTSGYRSGSMNELLTQIHTAN
ncbi:MAG TPA: ATP-dependent sacrificial sulfur transferase LarE [Acidobacteriaceae bacterium]|nr:ATP-dependent sacrificial sulfur transferase LarE [Acidobacteriaceae bacterium]